jgi:hypothetical protein
MALLSGHVDEWLFNYMEGNTIWIVTLSNGDTIYCDDTRPGIEPVSSWVRLRNYLNETKLRIVNMYIRFRSNTVGIEPNCDGYFFCRCARGWYGDSKTLEYFLIGTLKNDILTVEKWLVPELIFEEREVRDVNTAGECLIRNEIQV